MGKVPGDEQEGKGRPKVTAGGGSVIAFIIVHADNVFVVLRRQRTPQKR